MKKICLFTCALTAMFFLFGCSNAGKVGGTSSGEYLVISHSSAGIVYAENWSTLKSAMVDESGTKKYETYNFANASSITSGSYLWMNCASSTDTTGGKIVSATILSITKQGNTTSTVEFTWESVDYKLVFHSGSKS